jgi:cation diffusion facilitator family transporter
MSGQASSLRAVLYALAANFGIFVAKGVAAVLTGSSSMLAEAIHSLADCGNQGLLLLGMREARRLPSREHPFGYGTVVYFWAFLVSVMLFTVGGVFSIYEGTHKLAHPEPMAWPALAIAVLAAAIILEAFSLMGCIREIRKVARGRSLWRFFRESRHTELIVVLGEDIAALLGLVFALGAVLLAIVTGNPAFDAFGSIAVGVLLIVVAVLLAIEIKALITGQRAGGGSRDPRVPGRAHRGGGGAVPADPADGRRRAGGGESTDGCRRCDSPGRCHQPGRGGPARRLPRGAVDVLRAGSRQMKEAACRKRCGTAR